MNLERFKQYTIIPREPLKLLMYVAGTATLCCVAFAAYQGALLAREARHETTARWEQVESATGLLNKHMPRWVESIDRSVANIEQSSGGVVKITERIDKGAEATFATFNAIGREGQGLLADVRRDSLPLVATNLETLNSNQLKLGQTVEVTRDGLKDVLAKLVATGENVRVITDDSDLKALPAELRAFTGSLNRTAGGLEVIPADLHNIGIEATGTMHSINLMANDAQKKTHALFNPPPAPWWRKYLLQPIQQFGGATYLIVKIANGL